MSSIMFDKFNIYFYNILFKFIIKHTYIRVRIKNSENCGCYVYINILISFFFIFTVRPPEPHSFYLRVMACSQTI